MRIALPHHTTREDARRIIERRLGELASQYGHYASDIDHHWAGDILNIAFKAKGITAKGTVEITDSEVILDGKLPLIAKPFEPRIKSTVEKEAAQLFRKA